MRYFLCVRRRSMVKGRESCVVSLRLPANCINWKIHSNLLTRSQIITANYALTVAVVIDTKTPPSNLLVQKTSLYVTRQSKSNNTIIMNMTTYRHKYREEFPYLTACWFFYFKFFYFFTFGLVGRWGKEVTPIRFLIFRVFFSVGTTGEILH